MKNYKKITLKNLRSLYDLKNWIRENTNKFITKDIPKSNMLIIIDYLKDVVRKSDLPNRDTWLETLSDLVKRVEVTDE